MADDALVGVAFLSATLQVLFDMMASEEVVDFIKGNQLNDCLLKDLKQTLISVYTLWDAAEDKQFTNKNVKGWLAELKDVVYEAEDLLDEIVFEAARSKSGSEDQVTIARRMIGGLFSTLKHPFKWMDLKLENILGRLKSLYKQREVLNLFQCKGQRARQRVPETAWMADESLILGRGDDKEAIMEYLRPEYASGNQIDVIPIVGLGGLGKTTLAWLIYDDERVKEWFDLRAWVYVSEDFDAFKVAHAILQEIHVIYRETETLDQLQFKIKKKLSEKKFLFVLDDVRNKNDLERLLSLFDFGATNSKIIVTTRDESVGSITRDVSTYHLNFLTDDDCWVLLAKHAFRNVNPSSYPDLKQISEQIAKRCRGLPLAVKTLGGLLGRCNLNSSEWNEILSSNLWEDDAGNILPSLRLSYYYLPPHLKRCFAYCSIFPKGYVFEKQFLVMLWMAEGLLAHCDEKKDIEEVGNECFNDLALRSFFQQSSTEDKSCFIMHDLISDLAKSISGDFVCVLEGSGVSCGITERTRHLSNVQQRNNELKKFKTSSVAESLRTFVTLQHSFYDGCFVTSQILHDLIEKCRCLRVLSFANYANINEFPEEIGNLKHLRYLNMSETNIKSLPNSLSKLYYLQTLILYRCSNLVELPQDMRRLINMHYLDVRSTKLTMMPKGMGNLKDLRILTNFVISRDNDPSISELGKLKNLCGRLVIAGLQNVKCAKDAKDSGLKGKKKLKELALMWIMDYPKDHKIFWIEDYDIDIDINNAMHDTDVLVQLEPHTNLEHLIIGCYGGTQFPEWVGHSSFSNLVSLELWNCEHCLLLPPLGQLSSLKSLTIEGFAGVVIMDDLFYGHRNGLSKPFGCLESLRFKNMAGWEEWSYSGDEAFLVLKELYIENCPRLSKSLPMHLPSLTKLEIVNCGNLGGLLPKAPSICKLSLWGCDALQLEPLPCGIQMLAITCSNITDSILEKMVQHCTHLEELRIVDCSNLRSLPQGSLPITLKKLYVCDCDVLDYSKILLYASLQSLEIDGGRRCDVLQAVELEECFPLPSFPMLKRLNIEGWEGLKSVGALNLGAPHQQHHLSCLSSLEINDCSNFIGFQIGEGLLSATNIISLSVENCVKLKSFPEQMQSLFPFLESLIIVGCPEIESFPKEGLPSKLKRLTIQRSAKLLGGMMRRNRGWSLQTLSSFTDLRIYGGIRGAKVEIVCFPDEHLLPSSLTSLRILELPNLKRLDDKGFQRLTSLCELSIIGCRNFQSLPEKGLLSSSLSYLEIGGCPLLKERCEKEKGKDWPNISHIPLIRIDDQFIE